METEKVSAHADKSSDARGRYFGLSVHQHPYLVYMSNKGCNKTTRKRRLGNAFVFFKYAISTKSNVMAQIII